MIPELLSALHFECPTCGAPVGAFCRRHLNEPCEARGDLYVAELERREKAALEAELAALGRGKILDGSARFAEAREKQRSAGDGCLSPAELER